MNKLRFDANHLEFETWLDWYGELLKKIIEAKKIVKNRYAKLEIVEAFVLRCSVRWEVLVNDDIVTSLNKDSTAYSSSLGYRLRRHLPRDECKAILFGDRYRDFKSADDVITFSKKYLIDKFNPFLGIEKTEKRKINEFLIIRNYLAHYSDFAKRSYNKFMKGTYRYKRIPEPGTFLISLLPNRRYRWGDYWMAFIKASQDMLNEIK